MADELTLSVRLKADGSGFVGAIKLSKAELDKFGKGAVESERGARRLGDGMEHARQRALLLKTAVLALVTGGTARLAKSFVDAADESEGYRLRLVRLLGDQGDANRLFAEAAELAARLPFEYRNVMGAATSLAGVLRGGAGEVMQFLPLIGDLAAVTGLSFEETTSQVIRMVSGGAAAADLFRERGVLAMLGFQQGVTYSARETREQLFKEWQKADSQFRGAAGDLAGTWSGLMGMFQDKWFQFRNQVMDAGPFDFLKTLSAEVLDRLDASGKRMESVAQAIGRGTEDALEGFLLGTAGLIDTVKPAIDIVFGGIKAMVEYFNKLPPIVQEVGILGVLFGGKKIRMVIGALLLTEKLADELEKILPLGKIELGEQGMQVPVLDDFSLLGRAGQPGEARAMVQQLLDAARERRTNAVDALDMEEGGFLRALSGANVRAPAEQPKAALDFIQKGLLDIVPAYDRAVQEANLWKEEALKGLDETAQGYDEFADLVDEVYRRRLVDAYEEGLRASKKWEDGVERAFLDYRRNAADMGKAAEDLIAGGFKRAEDAVIEFVKTGKLELGDLFEFILDEMLRIQIRQQAADIFGGLDIGGLIGDLFRGEGGAVPATGGETAVAHAGGVIGRDRLPSRRVPAGAFAGAPRFHSGGIAGGEVPAILRRGEGVFTPAQMAALGAARGGEVNVQVINNSGAQASVTERPNAKGGRDIVVMIGEALARDVRSRGPLGRAIEDTYGVGRTLAGR